MPFDLNEQISEIDKMLDELSAKTRVKKTVETPALSPMEKKLSRGETVYLISETAKETGWDEYIDPDWMVKVTPEPDGDFYNLKRTYINLLEDNKVEHPEDDILESPEGRWELRTGAVWDYDKGEFAPATTEMVAERETWPDIVGPPGTPGKITPDEYNLQVETYLDAIQEEGRTAEAESEVKTFYPDVTEDELSTFFGITTFRRPEWTTADFWLENLFKPYGGKDLKGKAATSFIAGIGDVISTTGGAARWLGFEKAGDVLSDTGSQLQKLAPPEPAGEFEFTDLLNPEFYATKVTRTIPFALSLAPLAIGGAYGGGAIATALGIGRVGSWIIGGLAGAALSRPLESAMEAGGTYDDAIARGKSEVEAKEEADEVFRNNMLLTGMDAFQIAIALAPTPKWVPTALIKGGLVRTAKVAGKMVIVGLSEGGEEVYQDMITRHAKGEEWELDPVSKEVFAIGMAMGVGMGFGGDVISSVVEKVQSKMPPEIKAEFDNAVSESMADGFNEGESQIKALNQIAKTPEGEIIVEESIKEITPEVPPTAPTIDVAPTEVTKPITTEVTEIPAPEVGMPEAGLQSSMIEEVPYEVVRPKGKGRIVQISMEDQLKLDNARKAVEAAPPEAREAYEAYSESEGLKVAHELDPVVQHRVQISGKNVGLDFFISLREQTFPEYFTLKQARAIKPFGNFTVWEQKGLPEYNHVPKDAVLDELADTWNMSVDEIADRVMAIRTEKQRIKTLEADIERVMTEKPLETLPEPKPEEVTVSPTGEKILTPAQLEKGAGLFAKYVMSESAVDAWELTRELRRETRADKGEKYRATVQELIIEQGIPAEQAMEQAKEMLSGKLPVVTTDYLDDMQKQLRNYLFHQIVINEGMKKYPYEMAATHTALLNALPLKDAQGNLIRHAKAIPREKGKPTGRGLFPQGGSAWDRLNYVFGKQPQVMLALDKIAREGRTLGDVVEGIYRESGLAPIPVDQEMADYLRGLKTDILYEPTAFREPTPVTRYELPIEEAFKELSLWPTPVRDNVVGALKQLGMLPIDIGNFLRANKASFDFSFWRQQAPLIASHPIAFANANVEAWKAVWSQRSAEASWYRITKDPLYQIYEYAAEAGGDFLRPLVLAKGTAQYAGTEEFGYTKGTGRLLPRITGALPWVKISARAFETGANEHNWLIFKNYYKAMLKLNEQYASGKKKLKAGESFDIQKEMTDFSKSLANFTARGSLGKFKVAAPEFSALFFAPRASIGRLLSVVDLINANPRVRLEAWKNAATFVSTFGGIILLGAAAGWWEVEKDPRNAEYMSIRIGNTRIDPWGGYRQFLVFFTRAITGTGVSSVTGAEYKPEPLGLIQNLLVGKASPLTSTILDFWRGKNFIGEEVDVKNKRQWVERIIPFAVWDIYEAYQDDPAIVAKVALPAIVGAGVQTYTGDWKENYKKMGFSKYPENLAYGIPEPFYDAKDFWADTASQFKGVDPATLTEKKKFPAYTRAMAEASQTKEETDLLPNQKVKATEPQYIQMWQDRQKLVDAGDEKALEAFDKDERTSKAYLGNLSQRQIILLNEYLASADKAEFLKTHPELSENPRDEWYRVNPKENAILAVHGQMKVLTQKAYDLAVQMAKDWGYPENAIEPYLPPKDVVKPYFERNDIVDEWGANSWEDKLLRSNNSELNEWLGLQNITDTTQALELKIKNRPLQDEYDALATSAEQDAFKIEHPEWMDDNRRITAYGKGTRENPTPQNIVDMNVEYGKILDEWGANSAEAKLLGSNNPEFFDWVEREAVTDSIKALELQVKNHQLEPDSQEFIDNSRKIEAYQNNADDAIAEAWVERGNIADKKPGFNAEDKVWLADNPDIHSWALENGLLTDDGTKWNIPSLRITIKYEKEDEEYNLLPTDDDSRDTYLAENEAYRQDRRRREAYQKDLSGDEIEKYVNYWELPSTGFRRDRLLIEDPAFAEKMGKKVPDRVPSVKYDELLEKPDKTPEELLRMEGYKAYIPEEYIARYTDWRTMVKEGTPPDWPTDHRGNVLTYYGKDWYLIDHPGFYENVYMNPEYWDTPHEPKDFSKVPTPEVFELYRQYLYKVEGKPREDLRHDNPELDAWLLLTGKVTTPISEKIRRGALTPGEKIREIIQDYAERARGYGK